MPLTIHNALNVPNRPAFGYMKIAPQQSTNDSVISAGSDVDLAGFTWISWFLVATVARVSFQFFIANLPDFSDEVQSVAGIVDAGAAVTVTTNGGRFHRVEIQNALADTPGIIRATAYATSGSQ